MEEVEDERLAAESAIEDNAIEDEIDAELRDGGMPEREVAAQRYARTLNMAESATDPADAPERQERETDFNSDPTKLGDERQLHERS